MPALLDALDPFFIAPAPEAPATFSYVAHHQGLQVQPVLFLQLNVGADILEWLHEPWNAAFFDHYGRRNTLCQARQIGAQRFRFLYVQFWIPIIVVELYGPDPCWQRGFLRHASTSLIAVTRRACISAIPRASLFARSRPLR